MLFFMYAWLQEVNLSLFLTTRWGLEVVWLSCIYCRKNHRPSFIVCFFFFFYKPTRENGTHLLIIAFEKLKSKSTNTEQPRFKRHYLFVPKCWLTKWQNCNIVLLSYTSLFLFKQQCQTFNPSLVRICFFSNSCHIISINETFQELVDKTSHLLKST